MKKKKLQKMVLTLVVSLVVIGANAQKGSTILGNYSFSVSDLNTTPSVISNAGTETGVNLNISSPTSVAARSKQGYSYAMKCSGIELSGNLSSIGSFEMAIQNGSSGNTATYTVQVWDGANWITTETFTLAGNADAMFTPQSVITKSAAKIKVSSSNSSWFYGLKVYNNTNSDGAPAFVSVSPEESSNLPADGSISVKFDELVKIGSGAPTLGNAVISSVEYKGNTMVINYTNFTDATNPLYIPAASVTDYNGTALATNITKTYIIDNTAPVFESIVPNEGSIIHVQDLGEDARKIKLTFNEDIQMSDVGTITFNGAIVTPSVSGNVLTISYAGLPYSSTNTLTIPHSFIEDISGNRWQDGIGDFTADFITGARDNTPPVLNAQSVSDGSTQPIGGSIYFTFDEIIQVAAQTATINGQAATLSNNGKVIGLNYTNLPYSTEIQVIIPSGCIADTCSNSYAGTSFSFNTNTKSNKAFDYIVAKDATGDYLTIQEAINAASGTSRTFIYIKNGVYSEKLFVSKDKISLIGESVDGVIITWNECSSTSTLQPNTGITNTGTDASYTMLIKGNDFYGENFTVRNDYDYIYGSDANKQAVAVEHITGDRHVLKNVKMFGFQDTYYPKSANTRQYLKDCYILGGTDFIFGSGTCFIDNSTIDCFPGGQYITAASDTQKEFGIVLNNCSVQSKDTIIVGGTLRQFYLGRPWKAPAKTSFINCKFENGLIQSAGWSIWSGTDNHLSAVYNEYNSTIIGGGNVDYNNRVSWSSVLTNSEVLRYNVDNVFNYGLAGTWNPIPYLTEPSAPAAVSVDAGSITWDESDFAVGYLVFKDGVLLGYTTTNSYTDAGSIGTEVYSVKAYNEYGALSAAASSSPAGNNRITVNKDFLKSTLVKDEIQLQNADEVTKVTVFDFGFRKVFFVKVSSSTISISSLPVGVYFVMGEMKSGERMISKIVKQ